MNDIAVELSFGDRAPKLEPEAFHDTILAQAEIAAYVIRVSRDGIFVFEEANESAAMLANVSAADLTGKTLAECLPPEIAECLDTHLRLCIEARETLTYEKRLDLPQGRVSWKTTLMPVMGNSRSIRHVVGLTKDITFEKRLEDDAEQDRAILKGLGAALPVAVYLFHIRKKTVHYIGESLDEAGGDWRGRVEAAGNRALPLFAHPEDLANLEAHLHDLAALRDGEMEKIDYRVLGADGEYRRYFSREIVFSRSSAGEVEYILGVAQDISKRDHAREQLQDLSKKLMTLQTDERRRIAEELHDSTAQHLTAVGLSLARIRMMRPSDALDERTTVLADALDDATSSLDEAYREIRVLSYLLHPPLLEHGGFDTAIQDFVHGFAARAQLEVATRIPSAINEIKEETALCLFRVCQEALSNVHRHARATNVIVSIEVSEQTISLEVRDDGIGFDTSKVEKGTGIGLPGMRERMKRLGGSVCVESTACGTRLIVTAPR